MTGFLWLGAALLINAISPRRKRRSLRELLRPESYQQESIARLSHQLTAMPGTLCTGGDVAARRIPGHDVDRSCPSSPSLNNLGGWIQEQPPNSDPRYRNWTHSDHFGGASSPAASTWSAADWRS